MENAVQALKTAAAVLIFAIAISVAFTMFSKAKETADAIIGVQDSQEYLESAEVAGTLYETESTASNITTDGYRIVKPEDVISTMYRYYLEKYGVTIVEENGTVIARYDSATESIISNFNKLNSEGQNAIKEKLKQNTTVTLKKDTTTTTIHPNFENLKSLYGISIEGNGSRDYGAPWYGNSNNVIKRINADIAGEEVNSTYKGKGIKQKLEGKEIIEVVNEIDNSKYLQEGENSTDLLQQYEMPTIEIVYIIKN